MKGNFTVSGENAGVHLLLHFTGGVSEKEMIGRAAEHGVKVYGLSEYCVENKKETEGDETVILLGYANMGEEKICRAVRLLEKAWN